MCKKGSNGKQDENKKDEAPIHNGKSLELFEKRRLRLFFLWLFGCYISISLFDLFRKKRKVDHQHTNRDEGEKPIRTDNAGGRRLLYV